jgi:hypothetical protein
MDLATQRLMSGAAGVGGEGEYIDDLFGTALRTGNGSNKTIENNLDLSNEGGIVWVKERNSGNSHTLFATDMPDISSKRPYLNTNSSNMRSTKSNIDIAFYSNGYQIQGNDGQINQASGNTYVDWSIRKAPGFFDVVTYSGNGTARTIAHSLESVPGSIWVKSLTEGQSWSVYHRESNSSPEDYELRLDDTNAAFNYNSPWNSTLPTSTHFSVGTHGSVNSSGNDYIALIFAHDEQIFGKSGDASVIKCGSYTISSGSSTNINLGWEPQWVLIKESNDSSNWWMFDDMRVMGRNRFRWLYANDDHQEETKTYTGVFAQPTGFIHDPSNNGQFGNNNYIYIAIRRNDGTVGKVPDTANKVFTPIAGSSGAPLYKSNNHRVDFTLQRSAYASGTSDWYLTTRTRDGELLRPNTTDAAETNSYQVFDYQSGSSSFTGGDGSRFSWLFKRGPGLDIVDYIGTGSNLTVNHSLNAVPDMIWGRERDNNGVEWKIHVKDLGPGNVLRLNNNLAQETNQSQYQNTSPTATQFFVSSSLSTSTAGFTAILFKSISGISKIGTYTGNGTVGHSITVGFQPRFLIVKVATTSGNWMLFDTVRGWASGNDAALKIDTTAAQDSSYDYCDPTSTGFEINITGNALNGNGETYIYFAHA